MTVFAMISLFVIVALSLIVTRIAELDQRTAGTVGERAHQEAVLEQQSRRGQPNRDSASSRIGGIWRHMLHPFRERRSPETTPREESSGKENP